MATKFTPGPGALKGMCVECGRPEQRHSITEAHCYVTVPVPVDAAKLMVKLATSHHERLDSALEQLGALEHELEKARTEAFNKLEDARNELERIQGLAAMEEERAQGTVAVRPHQAELNLAAGIWFACGDDHKDALAAAVARFEKENGPITASHPFGTGAP